MTEKHPKKTLLKFAKFSGVAFQMAGIIYLGNMLGSWVETKYNFNKAEDIITLVAVFLAMYSVIIQVIKLSKSN